jgi:hypothetical protein
MGAWVIHRLAILALAAGVVAVAATPAAGQVEVIVSGGEVAILPTDDDLVDIDIDPLDDDEADSEDSEDGSDGVGAGPTLSPPPGPPPAASSPPSPGPVVESRRPPPIAARHVVRPGRMRPVLGRVVGSLRPTLRWRHHGRGVRIYNVQVFLGGEKILSAFPASRHYRVPAGRLLPGRQYVWRVWPYRTGRGYTARPLGVSWFATPGPLPPAR